MDARCLTLRDPAGKLVEVDGRLLRLVHNSFLPTYEFVRHSKVFLELQRLGLVVGSRELVFEEQGPLLSLLGEKTGIGAVTESDRIWFPSYPQEWPAEMLHASGELTLDIAERLLSESLGLKDATPLNILFEGTRPQFIDLLSFERREPRASSWTAFGQFLRTFINPLMALRHFGRPLSQIFIGHRDGMEAEELYEMSGMFRRFSPGFFSLVTLPTIFGRWHSRRSLDDTTIYYPRLQDSPEKAAFILKGLFRYLRKHLSGLKPAPSRRSRWSDYTEVRYSYTEDQFGSKQALVHRLLSETRPRTLLDVGCNTGHFSRLAARLGARVVATDSDPVVVGRAWTEARRENLDILPLFVNLARPTPAVGWRNSEQPSFLSRVEGKFDCVLMLAVLHHLLVTEGIPLSEVLDLAAVLTRRHVLIEFIDPSDRAFRNLCRGRDFSHFTRERFEEEVARRFRIQASYPVESSQRQLYLMERLPTRYPQNDNYGAAGV